MIVILADTLFEPGPERDDALLLSIMRQGTLGRFLTRPLELLLENDRSDWGFLRKGVPESWRPRFDRAVENRWIEPRNGGGIDSIPPLIVEQIAGDDPRRLRTWVLFDSDARGPGVPSAQSERARLRIRMTRRTHLITPDGLAALRQGDYPEFLRLRRQALRDMEREIAEGVGLQYRE